MYKRKETIALEAVLLEKGLDLNTELEILDACKPSAKDLYASLACARRLLGYGIAVPNVTIEPHNTLVVMQDIALKGADGVHLVVRTQFDENLHLDRCDVIIKGVVLKDQGPRGGEHTGYLYSKVEITTLVTVTQLLATFVTDLFKLVFNSEYEEDLIHMVLLEGVELKRDLPIHFANHYHDVILKDHPSVDDPIGGYPDLIKVAALLFHRNCPDQDSVMLVLEKGEEDGHAVLAVQVEEEA